MPSPRQRELLELAYRYALDHGLADLSLRPLAAGIGSSPRVLLFLFGSKEGLLRSLLARARLDEIEVLSVSRGKAEVTDLPAMVRATWEWLASPSHRPLLTLWMEAFSRSLAEPEGPWADFAEQTVGDWLDVLATAQPAARRRSRAGRDERTLALAVLRGALLDLLATRDVDRTSAAVSHHLKSLVQPQLRHRSRART